MAGLQVVPYTDDLVPLVKAFNGRMRAGGSNLSLSESPCSAEFPALPGRPIFEEFFLGVNDGQVRGGFVLKHYDFHIAGETRRLVVIRYPLSEGIVDRKHALVGFALLRGAALQQPRMIAIGMGGLDQPFPRMLSATGWTLRPIPFFFRVQNASTFLRELAFLRRRAWRRTVFDMLAATGVGGVALAAAQFRLDTKRPSVVEADIVESFDEWVDGVWQRASPAYSVVGRRDLKSLQILYPAANQLKLRISAARRIVGWSVVLDTQMRGHEYFGNLRVGTIADCFAAPEDAATVIQASASLLAESGVDLILSNQSHGAWISALEASGFLRGPSNYLLGLSAPLAAEVPFPLHEIHMNRGDGDGPSGL